MHTPRLPFGLRACGLIVLATQCIAFQVLSQERSTPDQLLKKALALQTAGDMQGAIRAYEAFLARRPDVGDARANLGVAYASIGNYAKAISELERALTLGNVSNSAGVRFNLGSVYFKAAQFAKAEAVLTRVVKEQPKDKAAALMLASCYFSRDDVHKVIALLSPFESELGGDPQFAYLLGTALIKDRQIESGERYAVTVMKHGDAALAWVMQGTARLMTGDYFQAADAFKKALDANPRLPTVNGTYGRVLQELDRPDEADEAFRREIEINPDDFEANFYHGIYLHAYEQRYEEALSFLNRALRARPDRHDVQFQIAVVFSLTERVEEAVKILESVVVRSPNSLEGHSTLTRLYVRLGRPEAAERHRAIAERLRKDQEGQRFIQQGRFSEAVEVFNQLKQANKSDPRPYFFAGMALSLMKDSKAAVAELSEAVRLDPRNPMYVIPYAEALVRSGQVALAMEVLRPVKPESLAPSAPELLLTLSETYHRAGRHDDALHVLDVMARRDPYSARINALRGQIYLVKEDFKLARQFAEKSIERQPKNNALAYSILGGAQLRLGDTAGALESCREAINQDPDNPLYLWKLGALYLAMGDSREAIRHLERARKGADAFPEIYVDLGKAYQKNQEPVKAKEAFDAYAAAKK
jgi:tetratricopeptide (TPR) repeat protein